METLEADFSRAEYLKDKVIPEVRINPHSEG